jgi:uncharacterized protein (DUF1778 family)
MSSTTQISAHVAASTKRELDEYAEAHGLKQGFLVEEALRHHLRALRELPADVIIPTRIVVTRESGERVLARLARPGKPTKALRELFRKR